MSEADMDTDPELHSPQAAFTTPTNSSRKKRKKGTVTANISILPEQPSKAAPLVGYFPSGFDPLGTDHTDLGVQFYRNATKNNRVHLVVSPPGTSVQFVGSSFSGESTAALPCTWSLGVFDKESRSLKIVPIDSNKILRLEPRVESDLVEEEHYVNKELSTKERADKIKEAKKRFGTKGAISRDNKQQSLRQEDDPNSQNDLDRKIKEVAINKEALESSSTAQNARNVPPYNSCTTNPKDVYPLDKIILKGEWDYIRDVLELHDAKAKAPPEVYPSFVINRIYKLEETKDDEMEKETIGCILSFIGHLIKFKDQLSADGSSSSSKKKANTPSILRQRFSTMFHEAESKFLTAEKIDLLVSYVLVLCLFVDDFKTDPTDIAKDLRMSSVKLREHFLNLGCTFSRQKGTLYATLPAPLKFPEAARRRRR